MNYEESIAQSLEVRPSVAPKQDVLRVVWWNCGLTGLLKKLPKEKEPSEQEDSVKKKEISLKISMVKEVIKKLIRETDIFVLGEFLWNGDIESFVCGVLNDLKLDGFEFDYVNLYRKVSDSRVVFDNFVFYRKDIVKIDNPRTCSNVGLKGRKINYKAYQIVSFQHLLMGDFKGELAIVHWGMRNGFGGDAYESHRLMAAEKLSKRLSLGKAYPYKILVGDFNNEPYESSFRWLLASRSIDYAWQYKVLYNPFWRFLDGQHFTIDSKYNHDFEDNGAVFDNIIVNSTFLDPTNPWELMPSILDTATMGYAMDRHDHYPVAMNFKI